MTIKRLDRYRASMRVFSSLCLSVVLLTALSGCKKKLTTDLETKVTGCQVKKASEIELIVHCDSLASLASARSYVESPTHCGALRAQGARVIEVWYHHESDTDKSRSFVWSINSTDEDDKCTMTDPLSKYRK